MPNFMTRLTVYIVCLALLVAFSAPGSVIGGFMVSYIAYHFGELFGWRRGMRMGFSLKQESATKAADHVRNQRERAPWQ